jgi:hypothetical protein
VLSLGLLESFCNLLPINDLPDLLDEVNLRILVIDVEGMFPNIDVQ